MTETKNHPEDPTPVREVMLFRDARGWGVSARVGPRMFRHWRFHTERQARFIAAVLELGPRVLPTGSSGSRRHARLWGVREGSPGARQPPCGAGRPPWPKGPASAPGPCESSSVPAGRFGSLCSAVEAGLELAASSASRPDAGEGVPWNLGPMGAEAGLEDGGSLSAALDAALEAAFETAEEGPGPRPGAAACGAGG